MKKIIAIIILLVLVNGAFDRIWADETLTAQKNLIVYTPGEGMEIKALDLKIKPSASSVFQGCPKPNNKDGGNFGVSWVLYLEMYKKFEEWGLLYVQLREGWGDTVEKDVRLFSNVNYNASDYGGNVKVKKFFYKHYFCDKQLTLSCGKFNQRDVVCQNKYAYNDDTQFINVLFNKFPAIEWPADFSFTIHTEMCLEAINFLEFEFNYFENDADWEKIFKRGMYTWQLNFKPVSFFDLDPEELDGNYRFYAWLNTGKHKRLLDEGEPVTIDTKLSNYGFGLSFDQEIKDAFGLFCRLGAERPDVRPAGEGPTILLAWFGGLQIKGKYWKREEDVVSFAVGQVVPSKEYIDAGNTGKPEGHIETYYRCRLNKHFEISPNFQFIWNPDGDSSETPIFTYGVRVRAVF